MDYICNECGIEKPESAFRLRQCINYREKVCEECRKKKPYCSNEQARINYKKRIERFKEDCKREIYKKCGQCKRTKHISEFAKDGSGSCRKCKNAYMRQWNEKNREAETKYQLKFKFGITLDKYNEILVSQNGKCAICENEEIAVDHRTKKIRRLAVDHCHEAGKVRGLLCSKCNRALGGVNESVEILESMIKYLKER